MNRRLVTSNDATRHPFRQALPLSVLQVAKPYRAASEPDTTEHIRLFLMTFTAAFIAISGFIW